MTKRVLRSKQARCSEILLSFLLRLFCAGRRCIPKGILSYLSFRIGGLCENGTSFKRSAARAFYIPFPSSQGKECSPDASPTLRWSLPQEPGVSCDQQGLLLAGTGDIFWALSGDVKVRCGLIKIFCVVNACSGVSVSASHGQSPLCWALRKNSWFAKINWLREWI